MGNIKITKIRKGEYRTFSYRDVVLDNCPECGRGGTFDPIPEYKDIITPGRVSFYILGQRICPNQKCLAHIFFIMNNETGELITYPHIRIDFDSKSIPLPIKESLEEAIKCESIEAYVASAIMVRRTLESLCEDKQCKGRNLKDKIMDLKDKVILPEALFEAMDNLRLLGNDAAHVVSKDYENIGKPEVVLAINLTKEILKACYQYEDLINELKSFKKN